MFFRYRLRCWVYLILSGWLLQGCSTDPSKIQTVRASSIHDEAPVYHAHDSPAVRRRIAIEDKLAVGYNQLRTGDYAQAKELAQQVLRHNHDSAEAYNLLAMSQSLMGQPEQAGSNYRHAAELAPNRGEYLNNYGAWLCSNQHPDESLIWFDRAANVDPAYAQDAGLWANSGDCALQSGQVERADRDLKKALRIDPRQANALASMASLAYRRGQYFEARAFAERCKDAAPVTPSVLQLLINIEQKLGDIAAVQRYKQQLITTFPEAVTTQPKAKKT